jgi:cytochrome c-type biogenesis protein
VVADVTAGIGEWWGPALAFAAGVVSFASPCVLPLVPGYLAVITGAGPATSPGPVRVGSPAPGVDGSGRPEASARHPVAPILLFILGFSLVFTVVGGFAATGLARWVQSGTGQRVAGGVVVAFGVFLLLYGLRVGFPWLYREERPLLSRVRPGPAGALPLGMAFAVGWTPCIGPVLGAILTLAAGQHSTGRAVLLLFSYSLGLGVPFLLVGLGLRRLLSAFRVFSRHYGSFALLSGAALTAIGALLLAGVWGPALFRFAARFVPPL